MCIISKTPVKNNQQHCVCVCVCVSVCERERERCSFDHKIICEGKYLVKLGYCDICRVTLSLQ